MTSIDLAGEVTATQYSYAGNFTVSTEDASDDTAMINASATQISIANLTRGNYSINDGKTGQEELYFYLEAVNPGISAQAYSSTAGGDWTITILGAAFALGGGRRRRKKKIETLSLLSAIFSKKLGCLEAVARYIKDNLELS